MTPLISIAVIHFFALISPGPDFFYGVTWAPSVIGMTTYGESAPAKDLYQYFGITTAAVVAAVKEITA